jgi:hypothetical protein
MLNLVHKVYPSPANYSNPPNVSISFSEANGVITYTESYPESTITLPDTTSNTNTNNVITVTQNSKSWTTSLNVYSLQNTRELSDYMFYYVGYQPNSENPSNAAIHNVFANTFPTRSNVGTYLSRLNNENAGGYKSYYLVIPVARDFETWTVLLETPDQVNNVNISGDFSVTQNNQIMVEGSLLPRTTITMQPTDPNKPNIRLFTINTFTYSGLYNTSNHITRFETTQGQLLRTRMKGNGDIIMDVTNINPGTEGKIKLNYQYFTSRNTQMFIV